MTQRTPGHDRRPARGWEWPTLVLALLIYGGWLAATWWWRWLPWPVLAVVGGGLLAWHSSLQHETIHGHPSRVRWFNDAIGWPPLSLWLPYDRYRDTHVRHHAAHELTDPFDDPESNYLSAPAWQALGPFGRALARFNMTLLGRLTAGTVWLIAVFVRDELRAAWRGDTAIRNSWLLHLPAVGLVLAWVVLVCDMPWWLYAIAFVLPGTALTRLRAFAEHRWADSREGRTAVVESRWLGWLFLHNNLHVTHHRHPGVAWYRLPALYREQRDTLRAQAGISFYRGYGDVVRQFLLRRHDTPRYPGRG